MGVIKEIVDVIVPKAQKRMEDKGISIRQALYIEFIEIGYIPKDIFMQCFENRKDGQI